MGVNNFNVMSIGKVNLLNPKNVCYEDSIDIIHDELHKTRKSFIKIGWYLKHIDGNKMYVKDGYDNIIDFSKDKFNLSQPTTNRFMRLCEEFSVNHNSPELDKKYENYSVSQLIEMVSMKPEQIEQVTSEMTVREIKEIKQPSKKSIEGFYNLFVKNTEYENNRNGLKEYFMAHFGRNGCGGSERGIKYECSRKGISLNNSSEITWSNLVKKINEIFPVTVIAENEDDNMPGQTSIEKDFPEYMPDEQTFYATSHKENKQENENIKQETDTNAIIIDGGYREIKCKGNEKEKNGHMKEVYKKILSEYFNEVRTGNKNFELIKDEDDIQVGDILVLDEWKDTGNALTSGVTGMRLRRQIRYVLRNASRYGLKDGYCIVGW